MKKIKFSTPYEDQVEVTVNGKFHYHYSKELFTMEEN